LIDVIHMIQKLTSVGISVVDNKTSGTYFELHIAHFEISIVNGLFFILYGI
jgi:hypothetical protein